MAKLLSIDVETYSPVDLGESGAFKYCESPDFRLLLFGYSVDLGPVTTIDIADGEQIPAHILSLLNNPDVVKTAFNAAFERAVMARYLGAKMPPEQWSCSMVLAAQAGLPLKLDQVCKAMGMPEDEAKIDGRNLIRYFCSPCKPTITNGGRTRNMPWDDYEKWERFKAYNIRDVEVENTIRRRLAKLMPSEDEQKFWCLDQKINDRGVRLDLELASNAIGINERYVAKLKDRAVELTGLTNPNSVSKIKDWLKEQEGIEVESLNKKSVPDVILQLKSDESKEFFEIRKDLAKTSTSKFDKMLSCACSDDHARGLFQFYGAGRTGRFAGRLIQLQNLPQNHLEDLEEVRSLVKAGKYEELEEKHPNISSTLSELIRTAIIPETGCRFLVADFSAIEARVIAWFAKEVDDLEEFRGEGKIYELTAARMFGVPKERIAKGNPEYALRAKGKVATLACGYGGGTQAMINMGALRSGIPESDLPGLVKQWRDSHQNIVHWWSCLEGSAIKCIRTKAATMDSLGGVRFDYEDKNLYMTLPSGRRLVYVNAKIGQNRFGNQSIVFMGQNQQTKSWALQETYGGKLAENCVQATARDCLRESMMNLDRAGYDIRGHIHDEVIINEPIDSGRTVADAIAEMTKPISWAPGLPLSAAGFETMFYMKD